VSSRRRGIAVAVLAVVAVGLAFLALRPTTPPQAPALIASAGAIATQGSDIWTWTGGGQCAGQDATAASAGPSPTGTADGSAIAHYDGSSWTAVAVPLAVVASITFSGTKVGVATGLLPDCHHEVLVTTDGGAAWHPADALPALADVSLSGRTLWAVGTASGRHAVQRYLVAPDGTPSPARITQPTNPCNTRDGPPSQVAAPDPQTALLLCQNQGIDERHVDRTESAGLVWQVVVDQRPQTGFDGSGVSVDQLAAVGARHAWALFVDPQGECPEGQIRHSVDAGLTWTRLTCPAQTAAVDTVYGIDFSARNRGALVGLSKGQPTVLVTDDGGQSWRAITAPPA